MSTSYVESKPAATLSLIEKKKQQWAREKEELAGLCAPWGSPRKEPRTRYAPSEFFRRDFNNRRSSLPPLSKNHAVDRGGETTSGYGSDINNAPIVGNQSGYESSSSYKDDRPKWREKSQFWDTSENDPPNWVKRGLQRDEDVVVVVSNTSPAESPQQQDEERPYTSCSSVNRTTFIRGQNVRLDSSELAERERRRQIAIAHQEAVRQQLEERERKRQEDREKRIKEEQEEELRIEREQEIERQRKESELRAQREKLEREQRRKEAIKEALEMAEKEAKLQKIRTKLKQSTVDKEAKEEQNKVIHNIEKKDEEKTVIIIDDGNKVEEKEQVPATPSSPRPEIRHEELTKENSFQVLPTPRGAEMALVLQTPFEALQNMQYAVLMPSLGNAMPIAVPLTIADHRLTTTPNTFTPRTENRVLTPTQYRNRNKMVCDSSTQTDHCFVELNNKPDSSDSNINNNNNNNNNQKYIREKLTNLELNYDNKNNRRERRSRSDERVEEKPKWGANRPPTRYMKQSEKDPFYQRRKLRHHQKTTRDYNKNSSDESQIGSPRSYHHHHQHHHHRKSHVVEKRRALWRKNDHHFFATRMYHHQTEIVPLESDKEQIYYRQRCECCCGCAKSGAEILKIEPTRLPDCSNSGESMENTAYIIDKITALHDGLVMKQERWERSPRTPTLSSSTRNTENN